MDINSLYNISREYAERINQNIPDMVSQDNSQLCVIRSGQNKIYTGITGIAVIKGVLTEDSALSRAVRAMNAAGDTKASELINIMFSDYSITVPENDELSALTDINPENVSCEVVISMEEAVTASSLSKQLHSNSEIDEAETLPQQPEFSPADNNNGSPDFSGSFSNSVEFADGFDIDESNPFYDPPAADDAPAVIKTLEDNPNAAKSMAEMISQNNPDTQQSVSSDSERSMENPLSKSELRKQAKQRKKVAKANFNIRKKF